MFLASRQATPRYGFQNSHPPAHQAHCSVLRVVVLWCLRHIVTVHFLVGHALHGALAQRWRTVYVQYKKCYVHDFSCPMFLVLVQSEFASHLFRITIHAPVFLHPGLLYSLGHAPMMQWRGRGGKKSGANAQLR